MTPAAPRDPELLRLLERCVWQGTDEGGAFAVRLEDTAGGPMVVVEGSLVRQLPEDLFERIVGTLARLDAARTCVDLSRCTQASSMVFAFLVKVQKTATAAGAKTVPLVKSAPRVMTVLTMLGLTRLFTVVDDCAAAQALVTAKG